MNGTKSWKKIKKQGNIRKKIKNKYSKILNSNLEQSIRFRNLDNKSQTKNDEGSVASKNSTVELENIDRSFERVHSTSTLIEENFLDDITSFNVDCADQPSSDEETVSDADIIKNNYFRNDIQKWAVKFNITHVALAELMKIINVKLPNVLPNDPRTLLKTARKIDLKPIGADGKYWHNGIIIPLKRILCSWTANEIPGLISLNFNFDGLPIHKSSKEEFWPILCNIFEIPEQEPFIIGIYSGKGKPKDLNAFLNDFVEEMIQLLDNGIYLEQFQKIIKITIRCFICDSPARAFIKGVCNFNGKHGCMKCTTVGDYSHKSHTVTFPQTKCPGRTNADFRQKKYGDHHKHDSLLLKLPIDMVHDFPVGDSLHLIDLGIMKRLITGWSNGNFGLYLTKWCNRDINTVNTFLNQCKMPSELHRAVRQLDTLAYWKATEFRTFFFYLSVVILPDVLNRDVQKHFLLLYCAITICSTSKYQNFLPLAKNLLLKFVDRYKLFYGIDYITSNVHNLSHIVDEVERFGPLDTFNAYPFENKLYVIKNMLRQGYRALPQVAKRLGENDMIIDKNMSTSKQTSVPVVLKTKSRNIFKFNNYEISSKPQDKYVMTKANDIIEIENVKEDKERVYLYGYKLINKIELFETPIKSSFLNIYKVSSTPRSNIIIAPQDIMCKLVCIEHKMEMYVFPLLHTIV